MNRDNLQFQEYEARLAQIKTSYNGVIESKLKKIIEKSNMTDSITKSDVIYSGIAKKVKIFGIN